MIKKIAGEGNPKLKYTDYGTSTGSYRVYIPKNLIVALNLNNNIEYKTDWILNLESEELIVKIIPEDKATDKTTENTSSDIDEVSEKQIKNDETETETSESTIKEDNLKNLSKDEQIKYFEIMKMNETHKKYNKDKQFRISINKEKKRDKFTLVYTIIKTKKDIQKAIGDLSDAVELLNKLSELDSKELSKFILANTKKSNIDKVTKKLEGFL